MSSERWTLRWNSLSGWNVDRTPRDTELAHRPVVELVPVTEVERLRADLEEGRRLVDRMFRRDRPSAEWEEALAALRAWQWPERS